MDYQSTFVRARIDRTDVRREVVPYRACTCTIWDRLHQYPHRLGASSVRDMVVDAWRTSADTNVGYPMISLRDIETGKHGLARGDFGRD